MTSPKSVDILCIGNALMDVLASVPDSFLTHEAITKASMTLIDEARALDLTAKLKPYGSTEVAGGSAANTAVGAAKLGVSSAYISRVANDDMGQRFIANMHESGVHYFNPPSDSDLATGRCLIAVTPDAQRSMSTYLGANGGFAAADINDDAVSNAKIIYLEGYLYDSADGKAAFLHASKTARAAGALVAITLSDSFCVAGHREDFRDFVENHADIVFANEDEICSLFEVDNFDTAAELIAALPVTAALTRSEKGSVIVKGSERHAVSAAPVAKVIDTTGAGDQYAAGFLSALVQGKPLDICGAWGSACAAEVISHYGAHPETPPLLP